TPRLGHQKLTFLVHPPRELQRCPDLLRHVGRHRRAENKCARIIDEMLLQRSAAANKRARAAKRLPAGVYPSGELLCDSVSNSDSASRSSLYPGRVGFVHNNTRAVAFGHFHDFRNRSNIAFHAKNALGNDESANALVSILS